MQLQRSRLGVLAVTMWALLLLACDAAVVRTGNVVDPVAGAPFPSLYVGLNAVGTLTINGGSPFTSPNASLGHNGDGSGTVIVTGAGSSWSNVGFLTVSRFGDGDLRVEAGGRVTTNSMLIYDTFEQSGVRSGIVSVTGSGSELRVAGALTLTPSPNLPGWTSSLTVNDGGQVFAGSIAARLSDLYGNGTITAASGAILDADLRFDPTNGLTRTVPFGTGGILAFTASGGDLGVAYSGVGSLVIADGVTINSRNGFVGYQGGSRGNATVSGAGTRWVIGSELHVNFDGGSNSILRIESGGFVSASRVVLGYDLPLGRSGVGTLVVSGTGSMLQTGRLEIGPRDAGMVEITNGGLVRTTTLIMGLPPLGQASILNMATGGMLALQGDYDDSLAQLLGRVDGNDNIRFWNASLNNWALLTTATRDIDYTLAYQTSGTLMGYTVLTVGTAVPEPSTLVLLALSASASCVIARRVNRSRGRASC